MVRSELRRQPPRPRPALLMTLMIIEYWKLGPFGLSPPFFPYAPQF